MADVFCRRCDVAMIPGIAILPTYVAGLPDFPGDTDPGRVQTINPGGPGEVVRVMKCPQCGYSVTRESCNG